MERRQVVVALRGEHALAVYIDLKSPYAYLAIDPTRAMARAQCVAIDWRPFTLDIPSFLGSARLDEKGAVAASERTPEQWRGARYAYMDARRYANLTGKTVRGTVKIWDSSLAGISMLWAKRSGRLDAYLDLVYPRFWRRELDIEQIPVLEAVLRDAGVATDGFRAYAEGEGRREHDALNAAAFDAGVFGVPTYAVGDELWFGREHLPRVAWLLAGSQGPAPEVENRSFGGAHAERGAAAPPAREGSGAASPHARTDASRAAESAPGSGTLRVLLDLRSPASYLALGPAIAFGEELGIEIDFLPLRVPPLEPPSDPAPDDDRGARHRRLRAHAIAREIEVYGRARGLVLREIYRDADPHAFEQGWLWLRERDLERLPAYLVEGFRAYWSLELDPSSVPAIARLVEAVGGDAAGFAAWCAGEGPQRAARVAAELRERGAGAAPGYLLGGEFFQGRQHLPMLRWILGGRQGPGPI